MQLDNFLNKKVRITQVKGGSKMNDRQKASLIGLGLRGIGSAAELTCSNAILGMVRKVNHVIKISLV
ncbi:MAG: 50S ribosomal protein L30 [Rickettsiales bacterium]|nr:50S ribosomal protein L30 [Rickettsiales bacterium]